MSSNEQLDLFPNPHPTDDEIRHDVAAAIAYGVMQNPHEITEREPSQATFDQGHAGGQLIPGVSLEKIAAEEARLSDKHEYYQEEFALSGVAELTPEELLKRSAGFERARAVVEARRVRQHVREYADAVRKARKPLAKGPETR